MGCIAAGGEAFGQRHAARRNELSSCGVDGHPGAEILDQADAARHRERAAITDGQVPRGLRELLQEARIRGDERERVLDRGSGEEAMMWIDRIIAFVPEKRRRDA